MNLLEPLLKKIHAPAARLGMRRLDHDQDRHGAGLKRYAKLSVFYCPLDFTWAVGAAMRRVRPDVLVLAELELWPNLIRAVKRRGAKVAVINGRLSKRVSRAIGGYAGS